MKYFVLLLILQNFSISKAGGKLKSHTVLCAMILCPGHWILLEQMTPPHSTGYWTFKHINIFWDIFRRIFGHQKLTFVLASSEEQWKELSMW